MKKYNIILDLYVLIKLMLTFFVPHICIFGVFAMPFAISISLDGGIYKCVAKFLFLFSLLWVVFLLMNFVPKYEVKRIARFGIIALSVLDILCLLISIAFGTVTLDSVAQIVAMVIVRFIAISVNVLCIIYCFNYDINKFTLIRFIKK